MAPVVSWCQQSGDSDERRSLMLAAGCRTGTPVLSAVPCTQWYARTHNRNWIRSGMRNQWSCRSSGVVCSDVQGHSARTAVGPAGIPLYTCRTDCIQRYPQGPSYTDSTEWWLVFGSMSAGRAERPSHATDLVQCCKTCSDGVGDVGVNVNTKIPGCSD